MGDKGSDKEPSQKGEMRRRWQAILEDGSLVALGSEGRLVASYVQHWAKFETGEIWFSMRYVAKYLHCAVTTVRRGVAQMLDVGILEVVEPAEGSGRTRYVVRERAQVVSGGAHTLRARKRTQGVRAPDTLRARSGHATCAQRTQGVRAARTLCARNKYLSIDSPKRINDGLSVDTPVAGLGPAPATTTDTGEETSRPAAG